MTPDRAAAVQIAAAALGYETHGRSGGAQAVVAALDAAGWLHDPAYVAALEAENERLRTERNSAVQAGDGMRAWILELQSQRTAFLDACDQAIAADPPMGRGLTARAARMYFGVEPAENEA